jgi:hypothetical protein
MKKTIILGTIALLLTACSAMEEPSDNRSSSLNDDPNFISLDEALKNADNQFSAMFKSTRSGRTVIDTEELRTRTRSDADSLYGLYLVNYEDGFAMLSADARRPAVLAISEEGSMHLSDTTTSQDLSNTYTECYLHCAWGEGGSANGYFLYVKNDFGGVPFVRDANSSGSMPKFNNMFVLSPEPNE